MENMTIREVIHDLNSIIYDNTETKEERDNATFLKMLYSGSQDSVRHDSTFSFNALNNLNEKYLSKSKNGEDPSNLFKEFRSELLLNENKETKKDYLSFHGNVITKYNEHIPLDEVFNFYKDENGNLVLYGFNYDNLYDISPKAIKEMSLPKTLSCIEEGAFEGIEPHVVDIALSGLDTFKEHLKDVLKEIAGPLPEIEFSKENYDFFFPRGFTFTPIGEVKLGDNQFEKLKENNRDNLLGAIISTLKDPHIILEERREKETPVDVYAKSFIFESNKKRAVQSVVVSVDGMKISVSSHERDIPNFVNKIKDSNQLLYVATKVGALIEQHTHSVQLVNNPTRRSEYVTTLKDSINENVNKSSDDNLPKGGPKP